ncbi:MAG: hypothetical protein KBC95_00465 [Candidatus Peribacteraceae bacterium]|nr:hypothetical protein [Candidatus Peribacteraceae bacterium]
MGNTYPVSIGEIEAITSEAQEPGLLATKLVLSQIHQRHEHTGFHLAEMLAAVCGSRDTRLAAATPADFHHLVGNLAALDCEVTGDRRDGVAEFLAAMASSTEGRRSAGWSRLQRLFSKPEDREEKGNGSVATAPGRSPAKRATKNVGTLLDLMALTYPTGIDLFSPAGTANGILTLDAADPITVSYGDCNEADTLRIAPYIGRDESRLTWTWHDEEYVEPKQAALVQNDVALVGRATDLERCFGTKLKRMVALPIDIDIGKHPFAPTLAIVRVRDRIALLLRRPRGIVTVEQGDDFWRFDLTTPHEDTYGVTDHQSIRESLIEDESDEEDTLLEP